MSRWHQPKTFRLKIKRYEHLLAWNLALSEIETTRPESTIMICSYQSPSWHMSLGFSVLFLLQEAALSLRLRRRPTCNLDMSSRLHTGRQDVLKDIAYDKQNTELVGCALERQHQPGLKALHHHCTQSLHDWLIKSVHSWIARCCKQSVWKIKYLQERKPILISCNEGWGRLQSGHTAMSLIACVARSTLSWLGNLHLRKLSKVRKQDLRCQQACWCMLVKTPDEK